MSQQSHSNAPIHSMPATPAYAVFPPSSPMSHEFGTELSGRIAPEQSTNVGTHSWDPATGGFKTLTAKREIPTRLERRAAPKISCKAATTRSYVFFLVFLAFFFFLLLYLVVVF